MIRLPPKVLLLLGIVACFMLSFAAHSRFLNAYYLDIILGIGINIILAVSLNLINGYTGQFSLGHAGFMAVGAYTAASVTTFWGPAFLRAFGTAKTGGVPVLFLIALCAGGLLAALVGIAVGVPSLRLKGDYLAIVTLG